MLNWILIGLDEREKVPVWQFCLVEDLEAFDAFPWGAHVYRRSIYSFKHALDGRRRRFEQRQRRKGVDVHTTETYNIYGLTHAMLIFAFEVIPELGNSGCGKRREIELSPQILKWELSTRPRGEKLNSIFLESGGSLYDADLSDIPFPVSDPERYTTVGTSDTEGPSFEPSDTESSDSDGRHIRLARTRWVRFTLPREPRTRDDSRTGDDSRGGVGGQAEDRRYTEQMDALRELQEEVRKSNEKRDQQHQEFLDLIRGLQGSTSHSHTRGTQFDNPPFDDPDGHRDFSPIGRTGSHQGDQQGSGVTPREEVTRGTSGTDTAPMEIEEEPQQAPHALIDPDHLAVYQAYKRNSTEELRDVDLLEPVGVPWFHRFQTNIMELEDTHMDTYLHILRKHQRYYPIVYSPRINILDSQFYSWLLNDWERLMGSGADKPRRSWFQASVVLIPCNLGRTHWALASVDLTTGSIYLMDPFRQEVPFRHRKTQLTCLQYFLPSMLHAVDFHGRIRRGDMTYTLQNKPFPLNIVSRDRVPQQDRGGNCGVHTLRLIEYLAANRDTFDWSENEIGTIREKMVVEVFCNS
ncbi:hypothetical protein LWI28_023370 [Acer negundo]|uniref:Ubiquitin-like protease family profile domain-containing protein n=1 Tax=Acer negundo TaxID=4023 RepID=A0AAD5J252_ACENE|nr:hypothetical protein LWI28_023370 [Acer negundo]